MKRLFCRYTFLLVTLISGLPAFTQDKDTKTGDDYFHDMQYQQAIEYYQKAWGKMKEETLKKQQLEYKLAECYRLVNKPAEAARWFGNIADSKLTEKNHDILLHFADALRSTGNCQKATAYYQKFLEKDPGNPLAINGQKSCELFGDTAYKSRFVVENVKNLNSADDDYAAVFSSKNFDQLFFSSNRKGTVGKDRENWTGAWFSDLYLSNNKNSTWETPLTADASEVLNTEANEGTPAFNKTFGTVYFTRCDKGSGEKVYCRIMECDRQGTRWAKPETVLSDESANMGQPWISSDELVIYFASDRQGGQGGKDLWMASRTNKSKPFGEPVNLGQPVNTPGDEMFPYLNNDTLLYFSSNGHPGFGGLDLFKSVKNSNNWTMPENLRQPLNSNGDDFALVFRDDKEGYLSSNRDGGTGGDDVYHFYLKKLMFTLSGTVKDERTLFTMTGIRVLLINSSGDTSEVMTNEQGFYSFDTKYLAEDNSYLIVISRENFFSVRTEILTYDLTENKDFVVDALLRPIPEDPIILPDILYDLAKWDLKPQYQDSLETLVKILKDNPNLVIELRSHTDSRASAEYNDELSQKRAQTVVDYLVSKGVDPGQLIAKGYGERVPRTLDKEIAVKGFTFKKGVTLTDPYIEKLATNEIKESAFELNRRTEFMVIAKDYKPSGKATAGMPLINIFNDSIGMAIPYTVAGDEMLIDCYVNDFRCDASFDKSNSSSYINEQKVIDLMRQGALSKENFMGDAGEILKNNQVQEGAVVKINKLRIGDISVINIPFTVKKATTAPLLLGSDVLDGFGTYEIDELKKQIIFK